MEKTLDIKLSPKQAEAFMMLHSAECEELLAGGAKGGAKTCLGVRWMFVWIKWLINYFGIRPSEHPPVLAFMGRKQAVDFSTTTLNTWKRDIPSDAYELKESKKLIVIERCAAIQYGGLDDTATIQKFNSAEYAAAWLDQADECSQMDVGMLRATLRLKLNGKEPPYKFLFTANPVILDDPDVQWLREQFIENPMPSRKFLQMLYIDNPYLPENYGKRLDEAYGFNPALLKAYKEGDWHQVGVADVVIPRSSVMECVDNQRPWTEVFEKRVTAVDVASSGMDEAVIYDMVNTQIVNQEIYCHKDPMDTVGRIIFHAKTNRSSVISLDKIGEGAGVWSRLCEVYHEDKAVKVHGFDSRIHQPEDFPTVLDYETYANYRAYAWFNAANFFRERKANVPNDPRLISQLSSMKFKFQSGGKRLIESKDDYKKRTSLSSPDRADAYVIGLDALRFAKSEESTVRSALPPGIHSIHPAYLPNRNYNPHAGKALTEAEWNKLQTGRR